jgi:curved DNA-binding protein CbpA
MLQNDILTCFAILEVESEASFKEVQSAYREMAKVWHPDRFPNDSKLQSKGQEKLKQINHAYKKLQEHFKNQEDYKVASSVSSKPQAAPSTDFKRDSTDNSYKKAANQESHIFNSNGFCTKCGFDRDFLTRTLRFQCKGYSKTTTDDLKTNKYDNRKQLEHDFILLKIYHSHWLFLALAVVAVVIAWIHTEIPRFIGQSHFVDLVSGRTFLQVIRWGYFGLLMVLAHISQISFTS